MKLISWNVRGFRACMKSGFDDTLKFLNPDIICLQETKLSAGQINYRPQNYFTYWNYSHVSHKGFGGVAIFSKIAPLCVTVGIGTPEDDRGRSLTAEYRDFFLVTVYSPVQCSEGVSAYKEKRLLWEQNLYDYLQKLKAIKPVIVCGDFNASMLDIDVPDPEKRKNAIGFRDWERKALINLLENGWVDSLRLLYPNELGAYTWWSNEKNREINRGLRLDYFFVDDRIKGLITNAGILSSVAGSDHCPIELNLR